MNARNSDRRYDRHREKNKRKGQRIFYAQQAKRDRERETLEGQLQVLRDQPEDSAMYRNVYNALERKHGQDFLDSQQ